MKLLRDLIQGIKDTGGYEGPYSSYKLKSIDKIDGGYKCALTSCGIVYSHAEPADNEDDAIYAALEHINSMGSLASFKTDAEHKATLKNERKKKVPKKEIKKPVEIPAEIEDEDIDNKSFDGDTPVPKDLDVIEDPVERENSIIVGIIRQS